MSNNCSVSVSEPTCTLAHVLFKTASAVGRADGATKAAAVAQNNAQHNTTRFMVEYANVDGGMRTARMEPSERVMGVLTQGPSLGKHSRRKTRGIFRVNRCSTDTMTCHDVGSVRMTGTYSGISVPLDFLLFFLEKSYLIVCHSST